MMAALLSTRFRRWLLLAVGIPAAAWALERAGTSLERRRGTNRATRGLRSLSGWLRATSPRRRRRRW
jgi:hypothetical protein